MLKNAALIFVLISFEVLTSQSSQGSEFEDSYSREIIDKLLQSPITKGPNCLIRSEISGHWRNIPNGSPKEWALAYKLIGRSEKAELLSAWN